MSDRPALTSPVQKAIWYIESHFAGDIRLRDVADAAGVSPFHLTRAFGFATGHSLMRYVRRRRLSEAARALANGEQDILGLALDFAYGSHEAFTRAFRDQFGLTPTQVREQGHVGNLKLLEAAEMNSANTVDLSEPTFADGKAILLAGLSKTYSYETGANIPAQWQDFGPLIGNIPGQTGDAAYGVVCDSDEDGNYDYMCAVEVSSFADLDDEMARRRLPAQRYAVFSQADHVSTIRAACHAIFSDWLPASGHQAADAPFFERYPATFDPETGRGGYEIWLPLES